MKFFKLFNISILFAAKSKPKVQVDDILAMPIEKILDSQRE